MTDVHSPEIRSKNMAAIKSANTGIERIMFTELTRRKIYFKKHYQIGRINTDIALPHRKIAVFIDGDFWHGYRFAALKKRLPNKFWVKKIENNIKRDRKNGAKLRKLGWKVLRFWEYQIKKNPQKVINKIEKALKK